MKIIQMVLILAATLLSTVAQADQQAEINATLEKFHRAAARADVVDYFQGTTDEVVFLGTDGSERWQGQEFRDFVSSHFSKGRGWDYRALERNVTISPDGQTAWFDEALQNEGLGLCRGSGVLVNSTDGWKIAQYNLSVPIPNAMVLEVVADIAAQGTAASTGTQAESNDN